MVFWLHYLIKIASLWKLIDITINNSTTFLTRDLLNGKHVLGDLQSSKTAKCSSSPSHMFVNFSIAFHANIMFLPHLMGWQHIFFILFIFSPKVQHRWVKSWMSLTCLLACDLTTKRQPLHLSEYFKRTSKLLVIFMTQCKLY